MYCYQCEQTAKGVACTKAGVCGKKPETAALQDLLIHTAKSVSMYAHRARALDVIDREADVFVIEALFTIPDAAMFQPEGGLDALTAQGEQVSIERRQTDLGPDIVGLQELMLYGLKGAAAYVDHAIVLGVEDEELYATFHKAMNYLAREDASAEELLEWCLWTGEINMRAMEVLDSANTGTYGHPEPTRARVTPVKGKAILISGHDLKDLKSLLEQTEGKDINVYTHGEMLPAHGYPELKKHAHLVGNYGGAWQDQAKEFAAFPGAILMTTNCIQKPRDTYSDRLFTSGLVAWPGIKHISDGDFSPVIEAALAAPGFEIDEPEKAITVGFGHNAVLGVADAVIDAVKDGKIRHFFLVGGCDGAKSGRNYYTDFATAVPDDCVILTLACGKYRFNKLEFGDIGGIPRLLDIGQCNDAYSAVKIATALSEAFGVGVNDLPLSFVLSWYEQKAVAILLTLLHLGVKNIRLGPSLPAFVTPAVLQILVDNYGIKPIGTVEGDLEEILGKPEVTVEEDLGGIPQSVPA